jgi:hypothetical protein
MWFYDEIPNGERMLINKRDTLKQIAALTALSWVPALQANDMIIEGFLSSNLRYEKSRGKNRASDYNWGEWRSLLSVGTPVKIFPTYENTSSTPFTQGASRKRKNVYRVISASVEIDLINDEHRSIPELDFLKRFVTTNDPANYLASLSPENRKAISEGRVMKGMTREQVFMSLGRPPVPENPDSNARLLTYFWGSFDSIKLVFEKDGTLDEISGISFALKDMAA